MRSINLSNLTQEQRQDILNGPALPPPPGVVPNFESPHNSDHIAIAVNVVSLMITILVVYLRAYAKIFCVKKLRLEDCKCFLLGSDSNSEGSLRLIYLRQI